MPRVFLAISALFLLTAAGPPMEDRYERCAAVPVLSEEFQACTTTMRSCAHDPDTIIATLAEKFPENNLTDGEMRCLELSLLDRIVVLNDDLYWSEESGKRQGRATAQKALFQLADFRSALRTYWTVYGEGLEERLPGSTFGFPTWDQRYLAVLKRWLVESDLASFYEGDSWKAVGLRSLVSLQHRQPPNDYFLDPWVMGKSCYDLGDKLWRSKLFVQGGDTDHIWAYKAMCAENAIATYWRALWLRFSDGSQTYEQERILLLNLLDRIVESRRYMMSYVWEGSRFHQNVRDYLNDSQDHDTGDFMIELLFDTAAGAERLYGPELLHPRFE